MRKTICDSCVKNETCDLMSKNEKKYVTHCSSEIKKSNIDKLDNETSIYKELKKIYDPSHSKVFVNVLINRIVVDIHIEGVVWSSLLQLVQNKDGKIETVISYRYQKNNMENQIPLRINFKNLLEIQECIKKGMQEVG